ncbi:MAG TPA: 2-oxoglutarate dehydrogenase complex dihydrolipoyllysine-residue succinyltransferase [Steroidobacteraceae bacterium]|jgi:2-oxoglutarate dehydrogenase E2 component (dihydrolipoamide succinyltransferase)|nr:2-oxoglutarate dehydrogenase complex dihydrolipoyllysine-residue succinyltransferase [Steroidobacteraceae bacterium]
MSVEIRVPQLPESVADATLVAWRKQPGQPVSRDENLADLETDKVVLEVPAPISGVLREIKVQTGASVKSGELLAVIDEAATASATAATSATTAAASGNGNATPAAAAATSASAASRAGPAARRVIEQNNLAPGSVAGSAPGGRITKNDALAAAAASTPAATPAAPAAAKPAAPVPAIARAGRSEQRVPMTRLRARIAERLIQAQSTQALLTTFNEVDLTAVQELRARYKDSFEKKHGVKLGFMSFFVKASIEALKRFPVVNASVENNDIIYHEYFDIGVAVSTERGLMVPVLRDADAMSFADVERGIADYAARARTGSITLEDLTGGTFSITNGGIFGSLMSTPIANAPQSAILGMHKIQQRPMAVDGQVVIRPMMYLAVTYDHRIIDGREAVQFLVTIKDCLEDPGRLLLGV